MKYVKELLPKALMIFIIFSVLCGIIYPGFITALGQLFFPFEANGSIVEIDGKKYSTILGQQYTDEGHMWGRIMSYDAGTYKDKSGKTVVYAGPSNLSPAGDDMKALVAERVAKIQAANPEMAGKPIPVDLVTCSGSGLDPDISPAAAEYQVARLARVKNMTPDQVREIIKKCSKGKLLGLLGEPTVNVLKVNLMLDGILK